MFRILRTQPLCRRLATKPVVPVKPPRPSRVAPKQNSSKMAFGKFFLIGAVSFGVLFLAINNVDQKKKKDSFTEAEYMQLQESSQNSRKLLARYEKQLEVVCVPDKTPQAIPNKYTVLDAAQLLANEAKDISTKYGAYLQELQSRGERRPAGVLSSIVGAKIAELVESESASGDKIFVAVTNFPDTIEEALKFEEKVCPINTLVAHDSANESLISYYKIVNKVVETL